MSGIAGVKNNGGHVKLKSAYLAEAQEDYLTLSERVKNDPAAMKYLDSVRSKTKPASNSHRRKERV